MTPKQSAPPLPKMTRQEAADERERLGIPEDAKARHQWMQYQLRTRMHPETKRPWGQADIARECGCNEGWVSTTLSGREPRRKGSTTATTRIREFTAHVLGIDPRVLFGKRVDEDDEGYTV